MTKDDVSAVLEAVDREIQRAQRSEKRLDRLSVAGLKGYERGLRKAYLIVRELASPKKRES